MSVSFGIGILPNRPVNDCQELIRVAVEIGYGKAWLADSQCVIRNAILDVILRSRIQQEAVSLLQEIIDMGVHNFVWTANMPDAMNFVRECAEQVMPSVNW
jgi:hypothetical protein